MGQGEKVEKAGRGGGELADNRFSAVWCSQKKSNMGLQISSWRLKVGGGSHKLLI